MPAKGGLDDASLQQLYSWVDEVPLSRPKRNIARDFADGVLAAEIVAHFIPRLVELHNYPCANSTQQKLYNWDTLNVRVLKKLNAALSRPDIEAISQCVPGAIEKFLHVLRLKIARYKQQGSPAVSARKKAPPRSSYQRTYDEEEERPGGEDLLLEKDREIHELRETIDILEQKVSKLEQLVQLKDAKIAKLREATSHGGGGGGGTGLPTPTMTTATMR